MTITTADLEQRIRQLSRDEAAYKELLALFQAQQLQHAQPPFNMDQLSDVVFETDAAGHGTYLSPTEEALRQNKQYYRLLTENTSDGIYVWDEIAGQITYASPSYDQQWGRDPGESVGRTREMVSEDIHPDDRARVTQQITEAILQKRSTVTLTFRGKHKRGHYIWKEDHAHLRYAPDGTYLSAQISSRDVTERKRTEIALRDAYTRYESLANSITDIFFAMDSALRYTFWNAASEKLTGISAEVALGKSLYDLFPEIRDTETEEVYLDVLRTGDMEVIETTYQAGERELTLEISVYPAANGIAVLTRDVTAAKAAQEQAFTLALEQARMRLLTDFIQHAAHEFRTPLSIIGTSTHLMLRTTDHALAEQKAQQVSTQVKRIASLIDMLLLMVRLESSQETPRSHVNLSLLLSQVLEELRVRYPNRPPVTQHIAANLPEIMGSADYLAEAFEQILDNAYRFTGSDTQISLYARRINGYVQVQIKDNGPGISPDDQPHLFELFWRKDSMGSTPGFGLGLAITRRIVLIHGGRLWVDSAPNHGTTFVVEIPL